MLTVNAAGASGDEGTGALVKRAPVLRDSTGYVRGYLPYMSFDLPLALRLTVEKRHEVALVEPPPTTGAIAAIILGARRIPWVYYAADVWSDATESMGAPKAVTAILRGIESFALKRATRVIAVSEGVAERVRALGARRVDVVRNGIDTELFTMGADEDASPTGRAPYLIYAGTASEWQGAGVFIDAVEIVRRRRPDLELVYMGSGTDMPRIEARSADRPWVRFLGQRSPAEAALHQRDAEAALVSIIPGRGYDFAYPTKVLAALACGTPVIFAGVGPVAEDIEARRLGRACAYDAEAIARAIESLLDDPPEPGRLREWVEENRSQKAAALKVVEILARAADR